MGGEGGGKAKKPRMCSICHLPGHTKAKCPHNLEKRL